MKIVCISDTHGKHRELTLPEGDLLIHAGDFMSSGWDSGEILDFDSWLGKQPFQHRIVIAGNHDLLIDEVTRDFTPTQPLLRHATYLQDASVVIEGLKFYGSPWTPRFKNWAFMQDRGPAIKKYWDKIPEDTDVLITHGGPQGYLDSSPTYGQNLGCADLLHRVSYLRPKLNVFGHIHAGYGRDVLRSVHERDGSFSSWRTEMINAAVLNEKYELVNEPFVIDLVPALLTSV